MYTLLYAMYASENGMGSLNNLKKILNEKHTHASRVAQAAMETTSFAAIVDFMSLYYDTMNCVNLQNDTNFARDTALNHITKVLDDGLQFNSEWYEPEVWMKLANHPVINILEPIIVSHRGIRRSSGNLAHLCSPVPSPWLTSFFKSTRFLSFVYAAYKSDNHHNLFAILPKASFVHLHNRLQAIYGNLAPVDKSLDSFTHGELICKEYIPKIIEECNDNSLLQLKKIPSNVYYTTPIDEKKLDPPLIPDFNSLMKSSAALEMPQLTPLDLSNKDEEYVPMCVTDVPRTTTFTYTPTRTSGGGDPPYI